MSQIKSRRISETVECSYRPNVYIATARNIPIQQVQLGAFFFFFFTWTGMVWLWLWLLEQVKFIPSQKSNLRKTKDRVCSFKNYLSILFFVVIGGMLDKHGHIDINCQHRHAHTELPSEITLLAHITWLLRWGLHNKGYVLGRATTWVRLNPKLTNPRV